MHRTNGHKLCLATQSSHEPVVKSRDGDWGFGAAQEYDYGVMTRIGRLQNEKNGSRVV